MSTQLDRIEQMLRALCAHLGVRDVESPNRRGETPVVAEDGQRYTGVVSRFEHGWGFIECEALNRNFFVHFSDIEGTGLRSLDPGDTVTFETAPGKDGRPKAVRVRRQPGAPAGQRAGRPAFRASRFEAMRTPAAAHGNGDQLPEGLEAVPEGNKLPDPEAEGAAD
jgi:cold shock CspA family protein